jgi:hypothetical protein
MLILQPAQLADEQIELGVGNLRLVQLVVATVVIGDLLPQRLDPSGDFAQLVAGWHSRLRHRLEHRTDHANRPLPVSGRSRALRVSRRGVSRRA